MNWNQIPRIPQRDGYGQGLLDLCAARPDVVVLDADVAASTRTNWVRDRFPDHFYNLGISEQDLVGTAAGLALGGQIPMCPPTGFSSPAGPLTRSAPPCATTTSRSALAAPTRGSPWALTGHPPGAGGPGPGPGAAPHDGDRPL